MPFSVFFSDSYWAKEQPPRNLNSWMFTKKRIKRIRKLIGRVNARAQRHRPLFQHLEAASRSLRVSVTSLVYRVQGELTLCVKDPSQNTKRWGGEKEGRGREKRRRRRKEAWAVGGDTLENDLTFSLLFSLIVATTICTAAPHRHFTII